MSCDFCSFCAVRHISRQEAALIHLQDFEKHVHPVILQRGLEYYHDGCIHSVEEVDDFYYEAEVEGSDVYEVRVRIRPEDRIVSWYCGTCTGSIRHCMGSCCWTSG